MQSKKLTALLMIPVIVSGMLSMSGCGFKSNEQVYEETVTDEEPIAFNEDITNDESTSQDTEAEEESDDYKESEEVPRDVLDGISNDSDQNGEDTDSLYSADNEPLKLKTTKKGDVQITKNNFYDSSAIEYAEENDCKDYLLWLADYSVNSVIPQAVERVMQIPVLKQAAQNGEISKYISVYLTFNDVNGFGAMEQSCYLGRDGHGVEGWESPFYYIGHNVLINLDSFPVGTQDDPDQLQFLESAMIHEIMHAFMTDYLFNLSLGTGRDGARIIEKDSKGKTVMDEYDRPVHVDEIPTWFQEGLAMVVENPYGTRRGELWEYFDEYATEEEFLDILSTPGNVYDYINREPSPNSRVNIAKISQEENTYTTGWIATLFLCAMAGEKLGYEIFDDYGTFNTEAALYGLNDIITSIHDGHSLDYVIADISFDYDKGKAVYTDTSDFEEKCFGSLNDPGLVFMQRLLYDLEERTVYGDENYMPSGSILPGYVNGVQSCMDGAYHPQAIVYAVDNIDEDNPQGDYFSISTIRMSKVALGGGRRTSYDQVLNPLTKEEKAERDHGYIGNKKKYIDLSQEDD